MTNKKKRGEVPTKGPGISHTILVVEDDAELARLIQKRLERVRFSTTLALNGSEAITWVIDHPDALLLLDYKLPDMNGKEVVEGLAERGCTVPFIVITGHGDEKVAVDMMKLGARDYLIKEEGFWDLLLPVVERVTEQMSIEKRLEEVEEDLKMSRQTLQRTYDTIPDAIISIDLNGKVVSCNRSVQDILGYSPDELVGKDYSAIVPQEILRDPKRKRREKRLFEEGYLVPEDFCFIRKDGETFPASFSVALIKDEEGNPAGMVGTVRDITKRERAEKALRESEEKYRQIVSTSTDAIVLVDAKTKRFVEVNKACEKLYGYSQEEFSNMVVRDISPEPEKSDAAIEDIIGGRLRRIPVRYNKRKDGTKFPVEISASKFEMGDRQVLCGVIRDISERLESEEALERQRRDLRRLSARLITAQEEERKRVSIELHDEFGQALTAMQINLAAMKTELPPRSPSDLLEELEDTSSLADELLERSRVLSLELRPTLLDDLGLVPTIRWYTDRFTKRLNVNVEVNVGDFEERLPGEIETVIYRVMQEAMTNISRHAEARNVRIDMERKRSSVMMLVEDDGKGFVVQAVADQETPEGKLGLIGMEERVGYLGGSLDIRSTPGKGTTIRVEIPMEEAV